MVLFIVQSGKTALRCSTFCLNHLFMSGLYTFKVCLTQKVGPEPENCAGRRPAHRGKSGTEDKVRLSIQTALYTDFTKIKQILV